MDDQINGLLDYLRSVRRGLDAEDAIRSVLLGDHSRPVTGPSAGTGPANGTGGLRQRGALDSRVIVFGRLVRRSPAMARRGALA